MINYRIDIRFEGAKFYPSILQTNINTKLKVLAEYGVLATKGRYAGQPSPYGIALLQVPIKKNEMQTTLNDYILKLQSWEKSFKASGTEEIIIDIAYPEESPVDITISNEQMNALVSLNAVIEFHSISKEDRLEHSGKIIRSILGQYKKDGDYNTIYSNLKKHDEIIYNDIAVSALLYFMFSTDRSNSMEENIRNIEQLNVNVERELEFERH